MSLSPNTVFAQHEIDPENWIEMRKMFRHKGRIPSIEEDVAALAGPEEKFPMDKKSLKIKNIKDKDDSLTYWLSRSPRERIKAVELLRKQFNGNSEGFQRIIRIIQQT